MNRDKREPDYPVDLESQFILRLPEDSAKTLRDVLITGENLKNRLTIQIDNDMRHGEVQFDHWLMHAKIVDLPTIIESLKTMDNKSFYKTADICQMMICKYEPDQPGVEEESPAKTKKKDSFKVEKKFLYPHGVTPPTKNVRKRRFRKTLKKKSAEAPEIEKEVKRLLRADNDALSVTWEVIKEDDDHHPKPKQNTSTKLQKPDKKLKDEKVKREATFGTLKDTRPSNVVDIFGGAVSDSDEEDNINVELEDSHLSGYDSRLSDTNSIYGLGNTHNKQENLPIQFNSKMFQSQQEIPIRTSANQTLTITPGTSGYSKNDGLSSEEDGEYSRPMPRDDMRIEQIKAELDELKQRRQRTQHEIAGLDNAALCQRFKDILHTLNQEIMFKEMEYQGLLVLQNSEDI